MIINWFQGEKKKKKKKKLCSVHIVADFLNMLFSFSCTKLN